jgi:hypothetical protein
MIKWQNAKINYSDYHHYYNDIIQYLKQINFPNEETNKLIHSYPKLIKPTVLNINNCPTWMIPILGIFNWYIFLIILITFAPFIIPLVITRIIMIQKIKKHMETIFNITSKLLYDPEKMI